MTTPPPEDNYNIKPGIKGSTFKITINKHFFTPGDVLIDSQGNIIKPFNIQLV